MSVSLGNSTARLIGWPFNVSHFSGARLATTMTFFYRQDFSDGSLYNFGRDYLLFQSRSICNSKAYLLSLLRCYDVDAKIAFRKVIINDLLSNVNVQPFIISICTR